MKNENVKGLLEVFNGDARNAMHSMLGFLELVGEGTLDEAQRQYVEACVAAGKRHLRGVEDVRILLGSAPAERPVIVDFASRDLFTAIVDDVDGIAGRKGVRLLRSVGSSVPPIVSGDLERVRHMLCRVSEAVVDALNGSEVEGIDMHVNLRALPSADGTDLTFEIMAPAAVLVPALLRALQQDDFAFDASLAGSGALGLAAARNLAIGLGGLVEASSDLFRGTRIAVTFRTAAPSGRLAPAQVAAEPSPEAQRGLRILVAEDSEDSFQLFMAYLHGQSHQVKRAVNGEEAVELAATGDFDLVFMDICMPVLDGYAATKQIREFETGKDRARIPIVVLSAEDLRAQRRQGALVGCSGHLSKPLRKHELLEAIKAYSPPLPLGHPTLLEIRPRVA